MSSSRVKKLVSIGFKFNGTYFISPSWSKYKTRIRHDEVEALTQRAFEARCRYLTAVIGEKDV